MGDPKAKRAQRSTGPTLTREAILEAVDQLVHQHGVDALRMRDVATRAGVGLGSIYEHFATREALVAAWEQRTYQRASEELLALVADHHARVPGIDVSVREIVALFFARLTRHYALYGDPAEIASRMVDRIRATDGIGPKVAAILRQAKQAHRLRPGDLDRAVMVSISAVTQTALIAPAYSTSPEEWQRWADDVGEMIARYLLVDP